MVENCLITEFSLLSLKEFLVEFREIGKEREMGENTVVLAFYAGPKCYILGS